MLGVGLVNTIGTRHKNQINYVSNVFNGEIGIHCAIRSFFYLCIIAINHLRLKLYAVYPIDFMPWSVYSSGSRISIYCSYKETLIN